MHKNNFQTINPEILLQIAENMQIPLTCLFSSAACRLGGARNATGVLSACVDGKWFSVRELLCASHQLRECDLG
jgi:hypothetical protein